MAGLRKRDGRTRWLAMAAVSLVIFGSSMGLLTGLMADCGGPDGLAHPGPLTTLCLLFSCGATLAAAGLPSVLRVVLETVLEEKSSVPFSPPSLVFHPPAALTA